jgi:hypothetical protein
MESVAELALNSDQGGTGEARAASALRGPSRGRAGTPDLLLIGSRLPRVRLSRSRPTRQGRPSGVAGDRLSLSLDPSAGRQESRACEDDESVQETDYSDRSWLAYRWSCMIPS